MILLRIVISLIVSAIIRGSRAVHCAFCGSRCQPVGYQWTVDGREAYLCPNCNRDMERNEHRSALSPGADVQIPEIRYQRNGRQQNPPPRTSDRSHNFGLAALLASGVLAVVAVIGFLPQGITRNDAATNFPGSAADAAPAAPAIPGNFAVEMDTRPPEVREKEARQKKELGAKIEESKKRAIAAFPALAVAGSPLNKAYVARYHEYLQSKPAFFAAADWPYLLARECAKK